MKFDKELLGKRIKKMRIRRKKEYNRNNIENQKYDFCITQENFAIAIGIDRRTLIKWEQGDTVPTLEKLIKICNLLDCNIEYFLGANKFPYIDTVVKASYFTGIKPEIIEQAKNCPEYLDCLNFFMFPENCSELFNKTTLSAWKKYWINQALSDIKPPLIDIIQKAFEYFYSFTPFSEISINKYKEYLTEYLPIEKINFESEPKEYLTINLKEVFSPLGYRKCIKNISSTNKYDTFIDYIAKLTYEPLINREFVEIQKQKVASKFIEIVTHYLSDI